MQEQVKLLAEEEVYIVEETKKAATVGGGQGKEIERRHINSIQNVNIV